MVSPAFLLAGEGEWVLLSPGWAFFQGVRVLGWLWQFQLLDLQWCTEEVGTPLLGCEERTKAGSEVGVTCSSRTEGTSSL